MSNVDLHIQGITDAEIKELLQHVRRIEQRDPERIDVLCSIGGKEDAPLEEVLEWIAEIFPAKET